MIFTVYKIGGKLFLVILHEFFGTTSVSSVVSLFFDSRRTEKLLPEFPFSWRPSESSSTVNVLP